MKKDIKNKEDIKQWIDIFYKKLLDDPTTKAIFEPLDLELHLPKIVSFWSFVLLDEEGYTTNVFQQHVHLNLQEEHFRTWIKHFTDTTHELFEGEKTNLAIQRARLLATTFYQKLHGVYLIF